MKPFSRSSKAGFTLVELIVVIAILAILAGVAIPVYSGYIKKANQAADNMLLDALNTAFQAASIEGGQYDGRPSSAFAALASDGSVNSVRSSVDADGTLFDKYFAGNEGSKFENYVLLRYAKSKGVFEGYASGDNISVPYGDDTITVSAAQIAAFQASGFASLDNDPDADAITELMGEVDNVTAGAAGFLNSTAINKVVEDSKFSNFLKGLGYTDDQIAAMKHSGNVETDKANANLVANALVLYTASMASGMDSDSIISQFNSTGSWATLGFDSTVDSAVSQTIPYSLMLAYINSEAAKGQNITIKEGRKTTTVDVQTLFKDGITTSNGTVINGASNISNLGDITKLEQYICGSNGFKSYMQSEQAQTDLSGFLSTMTMLDNNRANLGDTSINNLLNNGFINSSLIDMLNSALGNG